MTNGEEYDLTDHDSIDDELWWELDDEIKDIIFDFISKKINLFGLKYQDIFLEWG
jgi:hypothetical protein